MATLKRPPVPSCGTFAALAPQLQTLAEAVDSDISNFFNTGTIFQVLDSPFLSLLKTSTDNMDPVGFFQPVSFDVGFASVEATNNGGIVQGTAVPGDNPPAMVLPSLVQPRWYYLGFYLQIPEAFTSTQWKVRMRVTNTDPLTGATRTSMFTRAYEAPFNAGSGNEYIWADFMTPSNGGRVTLEANIANTVTTEQVNGGRAFAMQVTQSR